MTISNEQVEQLINEYKHYINKIINHTYIRAEPETKDELNQVGLIGLWKGINAYYRRDPMEFDRKKFVDTICAYIRYEMAALFSTLNLIRISPNQWRNFMKAKKKISENPDFSDEQLKNLLSLAGLRYDWYIKAKETINHISLDSVFDESGNSDIYNLIPCYEHGINTFIDKTYLDYLIDSAMAGIRLERDKRLIQTWLDSIYYDWELKKTGLGKIYNLSPSMVAVIIKRFIEICQFLRDCESQFLNNPSGTISFPVLSEKSKRHEI